VTRVRSEGPFTVDLDSFPLVRMRSPSASDFEYVDVQSFFACFELALARHEPFVLLHDARGMAYVDDHRQARFLQELAHVRPTIVRRTVAYAAITEAPLERGLITALSWACQLPLPTRIFAAELEARAFLLERYQRRMRPDADSLV
jgi:hypothetical protein